jgi:hypothetical protein
MAKAIYWLIILVFLASCYRNAPESPHDMSLIIPPDSMVSVLTDIHLIEGVTGTLKEKDSVLAVVASEAYSIVLTKHKLDRKTFEENIRYYSYHAEKLDEIYEKVINNLGKLESEITVKKEESSEDTVHLENVAVQE